MAVVIYRYSLKIQFGTGGCFDAEGFIAYWFGSVA